MRLRDPRYTGTNRCWPCTVLNGAVLLLAVSGLLAAERPVLAALVCLGGAGAITFRGYLVPGTPRLGRRLPAFLHEWFGTVDPVVADDGTTALVDAGVLTEDLALAGDVVERLLGEAGDLVEDRDRLERLAVARFPAVESVSVNRALGGGETWFALDGGEVTVRQWQARPVAALDVAAAGLLADEPVDWTARSAAERDDLLALIRYATPTCPACGEPFESGDGPPVACCGGRSLVGDQRCGACSYALVDRTDLPGGGAGGSDGTPGDDATTPGEAADAARGPAEGPEVGR